MSDGWGNFLLENGEIHVAPINDMRTHILSQRCRCKPKIEKLDDIFTLIIHSAWDFREVEEALQEGTLLENA
jgi:hypothetical protein